MPQEITAVKKDILHKKFCLSVVTFHSEKDDYSWSY